MKRREFLKWSIGTAAVAVVSRQVNAQAAVKEQASLKEIRIGYQKTGVLVIARQQEVLEKHFAGRGIAVKWVEFSSGPPMMEAMSTGSVDLGAVGDTPPIFAQAANANILYVAGSPITNGQGILVSADSGIRNLADLKGRRVGVAKGTSAHNVLIAALEKAGLTYQDITPVYLSPPDAGPAFANGSIDAWAIWDPYFAIGEKRQQGRILVNASEVAKTNSFYLANRDFANLHAQETREIIDGLAEAARWAEAHRDSVAASLAAVTGVPLEIQTVAANRASFAIGPITPEIIATQQAVADRFQKLGLIPKPIAIRDAVWKQAAT
ncbi:sulfonate ABC transporter substrate-binding protein [Bradyrhizobium sp. S69]|uniref:sulfonate ABC transporter substrate-binding protein n=1 Tax=Bradyrhizobium sp. S69 TaxID=1641856 RepID=UPI00131BC50B|nr:sulfonate ABC transporter substrate-binding protein [Bradyrhizobium sp. S69]